MRKRVLFCDDSAFTRQVYEKMAKDLRLDRVIVDDAASGWELIRNGEHFDLIVSDNDMPKLSGIRFLELIRNHESVAETPFVLFTAKKSDDLRGRAVELGAVFEIKGDLQTIREMLIENTTAT